MAIKTKLLLSFKTELGKVFSLSLDDPRPDVTESEIKTVMNTVVESGVFAPYDADVVEAVEAKVVKTDSTEYDLVVE